MVVSIGSRGSHIPAMTPRRKRLGVIAGMWDPLDPIETTMTLIAVNISLLLYQNICFNNNFWLCFEFLACQPENSNLKEKGGKSLSLRNKNFPYGNSYSVRTKEYIHMPMWSAVHICANAYNMSYFCFVDVLLILLINLKSILWSKMGIWLLPIDI